MKFLVAVTVISASVFGTANANGGSAKKSKSGSFGSCQGMPSCPNYGGSSKSATSNKKSKGASDSCNDGSLTTVRCGGTYRDQKLTLLKDLICDDYDPEDIGSQTITLIGEGSVLDCAGRSIVGIDGDDYDADTVVELVDGASIVNCNLELGRRGISTSGDGCFTIENVAVSESYFDGIRVESSGTIIIKDVRVNESDYGDGIHIDNDDDIDVFMENIRVVRMFEGDGIDFDPNDDSRVTAELYGNIFLFEGYYHAMDLDDPNVDVTICGDFFAGGSYYDGVDIDSGSSLTFAAGSSSVICGNGLEDEDYYYDLDVNGRVVVEDGAIVACENEADDGNDCNARCDVDEADACEG